MDEGYDLLVVGAGVAGCEAAWRASGLGARVLLLTMSLDQVNLPGHLPALFLAREGAGGLERRLAGTLFGEALARSALGQYAVPEQGGAILLFDRREFSLASKELIEKRKGLDARQALVNSLHNQGFVTAESVFGEAFQAAKAVVAPGCYLKGRIRTGGLRLRSGRYGDLASDGLAEGLERAGLKMQGWSGLLPAVLDQRRLDLKTWEKAERIEGLAAPRSVKGAGKEEEKPVLWKEEEDALYLLVPLGPRSNEAFLVIGSQAGNAAPAWAERAIVRMPVEQECLVLSGKETETCPDICFSGSFAGAKGYLECAEDGARRTVEIMKKGA